MDLCWQSNVLLFNMLSRLVIIFPLRSKRLLISWLQSPSAVILEPPKIKSVTVSVISPSICHEVTGPDAKILVFWMLSCKIFWWGRGDSKITADGDCSHENKRCLLLGRKAMINLQRIKKQRHYFVNKSLSSQGYGFSSGHVRMWELDYKESWAQKNWCFWTVVLEKTLESPLDCKEIQPIHPKGNQSWVFTVGLML